MDLKKLTPNLMVEDVNHTVSFYGDVLGFEFVMAVSTDGQEIITTWQNDKPLDFALMKCGSVEVMFQARKSLSEEFPALDGLALGGSLTLYIAVTGIKEIHAELTGKATIIKELQTTFYGMQEFYIQDCNGYIIGFAEQA